MTPAEKGTIEVFCREFTQAFQMITGKMIVIDPDLLACQIENDQCPGKDRIPKGNHNDLYANECSEEFDKISRLLPTSPDRHNLQVKKT